MRYATIMAGEISVEKHKGLNPPGLEYALLPPHALPFLIVSLGHAHGFPIAL